MACPFFGPATRLDAESGPSRYPLGALHAGHCHATSAAPFEPPLSILRECCNFGYARGKCPHFPTAEAPDAVRFGIADDREGAIRLHYVVERDHHPFSYTTLEYETASGHLRGENLAALAAEQARCYVEHYLRKRTA